VHIEPVWFRNDATFLLGHFDVLVLPIISALSRQGEKIELGISSSVLNTLGGVNMARHLATKDVDVRLFVSQVSKMLRDVGFSKAAYCRDIFQDNNESFPNLGLHERLRDIVDGFSPDITITTSKNRYLEAVCAENGTPLICTEMGPLPRMGFPENRHLSLGQHLSWRISDNEDLSDGGDALEFILAKQNCAIQASPMHQKIVDFVNAAKAQGSVALLALQPSDWVTWEGALEASFSPAEIILIALEKMQSDRLIVLFHPDLRGKVDTSVLAEIWLSDPRLIRAPEDIETGLAEVFIPYVDELLTVSSNLGLLAFLYGKRLRALGDSFVMELERISEKEGDAKASQKRIANIVLNRYHLDAVVFEDEDNLRNVIIERMRVEGFESAVEKLSARAAMRSPAFIGRNLSDNLEQIHQLIKNNIESHDSGTLYQNFGRNFLGYTLPKGSVGAELGVASGYFSESLLMSGRFRKLYSVDAWSDHHNEQEYQYVCARLSRFGNRSKILRNTFDEAFDIIRDGSLDFLYVDGYAHTGMNAEVILKWLPKLSKGAVISGHDYCVQTWPLNYSAIQKALNTESFGEISVVPGVVTGNNEDAIPSFAVTRLIAPPPNDVDKSIWGFWGRRR
jgi:hypothetical protein